MGRGGGSGNCLCVDTGNRIGVSFHRLSKWNDLLTKGFKVIVSCEETNKPSRIRNGVCKFYENCSCCSRIGYGLGIQTRDGLRILFHGFAKDNNLLTKGRKVVITSEKCNSPTGIRNGVRELYERLTRCRRIHNSICIKTSYSVRVFFNRLAKRNKLISKGVHIVVSSEKGNCATGIGQSSSHFGHRFTSNRGILNSVGIQSLDAVSKVHHGLAKAGELIPELFHVVFASKESDHSSAIGQSCGHFSQCLTSNSGCTDQISIQTGNGVGELHHGLAKRHKLFCKVRQRRTASEPRGQTLQQIGGSNEDDCFGKRLDSGEHIRADAAGSVDEGLNICHERGQICSDLRERTGDTAHETAYNSPNESADSISNSLEELTAFANKPLKAGDLCQGSNSSQNNRQFCYYDTHAENTGHSCRDEPRDSTERCNQSRKQTNSRDPLNKGTAVNIAQSTQNAGEECADNIHRGLNELRNITSDPFEHLDQKLHHRIYDLRSVSDQRRQYAGH